MWGDKNDSVRYTLSGRCLIYVGQVSEYGGDMRSRGSVVVVTRVSDLYRPPQGTHHLILVYLL